ncbi:MAG TPA: beta-propeller domain-containing protein, partial [Candidatus Hydrogenedentes bacterium]|nr:beta-propeller domain-containing protein [Candidatus Hydrogenedentota bacterium]
PLFIIDLSDPTAPKVAGELKVPGYSVHIEPRGSRLIGIGMDDTTGSWKVAATLFDVSDPTQPTELSRVTVGSDWGWSPAFSDVKALTVLDDMILLPVSGWAESGPYDRVQFIQWTNDTLSPLGSVDVQGAAQRTFRSEDEYYCVTPDEVDVIALDGDLPAVTTVIPLTSDIRDCVRLNNGYWARITAKQNGQTAYLETADAPDGIPLSEIQLPDSDIVDALVQENDIIVVSRGWDGATGAGYYSGVRVSVNETGMPDVQWKARWDVAPWWGWWGWYDIMPVVRGEATTSVENAGTVSIEAGTADAAVSSEKRVAPGYGWWWPGIRNDQPVLLASGKLVLRCYGDTWTETLGKETAWQGLAFVDAASGNLEATVGLGFAETGNIRVGAEGQLLISYKDSQMVDDAGRPVCAWYLAVLNPANRQIIDTANVPGNVLTALDADSFLLEDWQYAEDGSVSRQLNSINWNPGGGNPVQPVENLPLGQNWADIQAFQGTVWLSVYDSVWQLEKLAFNGDGRLRDRQSLVPGPGWGSILAWNDMRVCFQTDGNVLIQATFEDQQLPKIESVTAIMGWPVKGRIIDDTAVVSLGKAGIALLVPGSGLN